MQYLGSGKRKYFRGTNYCGSCGSGVHTACRPKLDGTLCTCTCERAAIARQEVERKIAAAIAAGEQEPTIKEALSVLYPRWEQEFPTEI